MLPLLSLRQIREASLRPFIFATPQFIRRQPVTSRRCRETLADSWQPTLGLRHYAKRIDGLLTALSAAADTLLRRGYVITVYGWPATPRPDTYGCLMPEIRHATAAAADGHYADVMMASYRH